MRFFTEPKKSVSKSNRIEKMGDLLAPVERFKQKTAELKL
jgi:hypothetical protein